MRTLFWVLHGLFYPGIHSEVSFTLNSPPRKGHGEEKEAIATSFSCIGVGWGVQSSAGKCCRVAGAAITGTQWHMQSSSAEACGQEGRIWG